MEERRRSKRTEMQAKIMMKRLDDNNVEEISVELVDVSKSGVGFLCDEPLTIGAIYECDLMLWTKEVIHVLLEIVRIEKSGDNFIYGASFMGVSEVDRYRIEVYQTVKDTVDEQHDEAE